MNVKCGVMIDLLPLYVDGIATEDTKIIVEEHLRECESCQKYLKELTEGFPNFELESQMMSVLPLKKIKNKIRVKNILVGVFVSFSIFILVVLAFNLPTQNNPIEYRPQIATILPAEEGHVYLQFEADKSLTGVHSTNRIVVKDGVKMSVVYFHFTDSFWSRNFSKDYQLSGDISFGKVCVFKEGAFGQCEWEVERPVAAVYYFPYSLAGVTDMDLVNKSILMWER